MSSGSDDNEYVNKSFSQNRKGAAEVCAPQIRELLREWYDEPDENIHNVEREKDGKYDRDKMDTVKLVEYSGIDWLIQTDGTTVGVGQRIRKDPEDWRDMTFRTSNGTGNPSERQTIPAALEHDGLYPRDYVLAVRDGFDVHRAALLRTDEVLAACEDGSVAERGPYQNDDGSAYTKIQFAELAVEGIVKEVWFE